MLTPPTAHHFPGWVGQAVDTHFSEATGCPVTVLNDADAAGLAEVRFGAGKGVAGVVVTITLGTGVGGGLFMDGRLVSNLEIGKLYLPGHDEVVEQYVASRIRDEETLDWAEYASRVTEFLRHVEHLLSPQTIIIGGEPRVFDVRRPVNTDGGTINGVEFQFHVPFDSFTGGFMSYFGINGSFTYVDAELDLARHTALSVHSSPKVWH